MNKQTIVSTNFECEVTDIKNEPHLKITIKGISHKSYSSNNPSYVKQNFVELYIPLWGIPYMLRGQRESIAKWKKRQEDFVGRIVSSYKQDLPTDI